MNDIIGYAKVNVKAGETIATIDYRTNKVSSKVLRFRPWGKKKLIRMI